MAADAQQVAHRIPGENSNLPAMVLVAGWLIPGSASDPRQVDSRVAALSSILGMFLLGLAMQGKIYSPSTGDILDILGFAGQLGLGLLSGLAHWLGWGATSSVQHAGRLRNEVHRLRRIAELHRGG